MKYFLIVAVVAAAMCNVAIAEDAPIGGVLTEKRIVNLPKDQVKWYISVVGSYRDRRYYNIKKWFSAGDLYGLRRQVHYNTVDSRTTKFKTRYASSIKELPTIRLQNAEGGIVYEAHGDSIPMSAEGLYAAIADAVNGVQEPILPWRRKHVHPDRKCGPDGCPEPDEKEEEKEEEENEPVAPNFNTPKVSPRIPFVQSAGIGAAAALGLLGLGGFLALVISAKRLLNRE